MKTTTPAKQTLPPLPPKWSRRAAELPRAIRDIEPVEDLVVRYDQTLEEAVRAIDDFKSHDRGSLESAQAADDQALIEAAVAGRDRDPGRKHELRWHRERKEAHEAAVEALETLDNIRAEIADRFGGEDGASILERAMSDVRAATKETLAKVVEADQAIERLEALGRVQRLIEGSRESGKLVPAKTGPLTNVSIFNAAKPPPTEAREALAEVIQKLERADAKK